MSYYYTFFALLLFSCHASGNIIQRRISRQAEYTDCKTPNNTPGLCVPIRQCPLLFEILKIIQSLDKENYTFLRKSSCGKPGEQPPKVCCNLDTIAYDTQTPVDTAPSETTQSALSARVPSSPTPSDHNAIDRPVQKDYSVCGKSRRTANKIIGGQNATLGAWPWMVALGYRRGNEPTTLWQCGGSLISDRWVLTAGHCIDGIGSLRLITARFGELHLDESFNDGASPVDIEVEDIIPHPQLTISPLTNDIALLRLKKPVTFTENIRPICLLSTDVHKSDNFYANQSPYVAGWGHTSFRGIGSKMLQETQVDIVDREFCAQRYKPLTRSPIDIRSLCANRQGRDTCQGDSGGPLMIPFRSSYYLAGIVSFGAGCANPDYPGVYTRAAYYSDWVRSVTGIKT